MVKLHHVGSVCAQELKVLSPKAQLRPRNAKMDAFIRKVRGSLRYDVANAAESVGQALEVFEQEDGSV